MPRGVSQAAGSRRAEAAIESGPRAALLLLLMGAALFAPGLGAQARIFPDQIGAYQRSAPKTIGIPDQALYDEYGLDGTESAEYTAPDKKHFSATAWRMHDSTGALALYELRRPAGAVTSNYTPMAVQAPDGVVFLFENYVFQFTGDLPDAESLHAFYEELPKLENSPLPVLSRALPPAGLVPNSERYIIGPVSLQRFMPQVPPSTAAFRFGAEAQLGKYNTPKGLLTLAIFDYPTPTMARDQAVEFQKIPGAMVKRTGPLVVVSVTPPDPDAAERLLGRINYQAQVTENTKVPVNEVKGFGGALLSMVALAGILIGLCLIGGVGFGGFRILRRKLWKSGDPDAMIVLGIDKVK